MCTYQHASIGHGQELQEESTINGQVATNAKTKAGQQCASADPVRSTANAEAKDTRNSESAVEREPATDYIGHDTPERGANAEAEEEGQGGITHSVRVDTKVCRE